MTVSLFTLASESIQGTFFQGFYKSKWVFFPSFSFFQLLDKTSCLGDNVLSKCSTKWPISKELLLESLNGAQYATALHWNTLCIIYTIWVVSMTLPSLHPYQLLPIVFINVGHTRSPFDRQSSLNCQWPGIFKFPLRLVALSIVSTNFNLPSFVMARYFASLLLLILLVALCLHSPAEAQFRGTVRCL